MRPPIFGLQWLVNSPKYEAIAIAEDGYSVPICTYDPRAFVLHKIWLSQRDSRDPTKAKRDLSQAKAVKEICDVYLKLDFSEADLKFLPKKIRDIF